MGIQAECFELLKYRIRQIVLDGLPLASFTRSRLARADYPGDAVAVYQFWKYFFRFTKRNMESLPQVPEVALKCHQALPEKPPAMSPMALLCSEPGWNHLGSTTYTHSSMSDFEAASRVALSCNRRSRVNQ